MDAETLKIIASVCSILGSAILAYRVTGILAALRGVAYCHELNLMQLMNPNSRDLVQFANSAEHVRKAQKNILLYIGFALIILSAVIQLLALLWK